MYGALASDHTELLVIWPLTSVWALLKENVKQNNHKKTVSFIESNCTDSY